MSNNKIYTINHTDASVQAIDIPRRIFITDLVDITLIGKRTLEYGEFLNENLLHLMEHFACKSSPTASNIPDPDSKMETTLVNPVIGQLWYNTTLKCIHVYNGVAWVGMASKVDISGNSGFIYDGEFVPIPLDEHGTQFALSNCTINISPMFMDIEIESFICEVNQIGAVTCKYTPVGGVSQSAYATYVIICQGDCEYTTPVATPMITVTMTPTLSVTPTLTLTPTPTVTPSQLLTPYCSGAQTTLRGSAGLTRIQNANQDDANINIVVPFDFYMFGTNYGNNANGGIFLGSNSYVTFGVGKNIYSGITPSTIGTALLIGSGDRSYNRIYTGLQDGGTSFIIRFEGGIGTSSVSGSPTLVWELTFFQNSNYLQLVVGDGSSVASGISGISNGTAYVPTMAFTQNTSYALSSDLSGNDWTICGGSVNVPSVVTPTPSLTPTLTPTITLTPTVTPTLTPSSTPMPPYSKNFYMGSASGNTVSVAYGKVTNTGIEYYGTKTKTGSGYAIGDGTSHTAIVVHNNTFYATHGNHISVYKYANDTIEEVQTIPVPAANLYSIGGTACQLSKYTGIIIDVAKNRLYTTLVVSHTSSPYYRATYLQSYSIATTGQLTQEWEQFILENTRGIQSRYRNIIGQGMQWTTNTYSHASYLHVYNNNLIITISQTNLSDADLYSAPSSYPDARAQNRLYTINGDGSLTYVNMSYIPMNDSSSTDFTEYHTYAAEAVVYVAAPNIMWAYAFTSSGWGTEVSTGLNSAQGEKLYNNEVVQSASGDGNVRIYGVNNAYGQLQIQNLNATGGTSDGAGTTITLNKPNSNTVINYKRLARADLINDRIIVFDGQPWTTNTNNSGYYALDMQAPYASMTSPLTSLTPVMYLVPPDGGTVYTLKLLDYDIAVASTGDQYWNQVVAMLNFETPADAWYDPKNLTSWTLSGGTLSNTGLQSTNVLEGGSSMSWSYLANSSMMYPAILTNGWLCSASGSKYTMEALIKIDSVSTSNAIEQYVISLTQGHKISIVKPSGPGTLFHFEARTYYGDTTFVTSDIAVGVVYHVALVKDGNKARFFVNGVYIGESTETNTSAFGYSRVAVSNMQNNGFTYTTDALRLTFGAARYWSSFTPPTNFPTYY